MPCHTERSHDEIERDHAEVKAVFDNLTRLLCAACRCMEAKNRLEELPREVIDWYDDHKAFDQREGRV